MTDTGFVRSSKDVRDFTFEPPGIAIDFPDEYSILSGVPMQIKTQGSIGACTAYALSSAVEYFHFKQHGEMLTFSPGFIYGCRELTGRTSPGISFREGLHTLKTYGTVLAKDFKLTEVPDVIRRFQSYADKELAYPNRISGYIKCSTEADIKYALMLGLPVVIAHKWAVKHTVKGGVISFGPCRSVLHSTLCHGWDKAGFRILNSWGKGWGVKGCGVMPYDVPVEESFALTDSIYDIGSAVHKPKRGAVRDLGYTVVNALMRVRAE